MNVKQFIRVLVTLTAVLLMASYAVAQGNGGGHGNGNGGGGGSGGGAAYTIIPFMPAGSTSTTSYITDINDPGQTVGSLGFADGHVEAFYLDIATQTYTALPAGVFVSGINNLGQMVGEVEDVANYWHYLGAVPKDLPPLTDNDSTYAGGINDDGVIFGGSGGKRVIWRVQNNVVVDGPVELPPLNEEAADTFAVDISETMNGTVQIVGVSVGVSGYQAVVWTIDYSGGTFNTPQPPVAVDTLGAPESNGRGINKWGDVCGDAILEGTDFFPFVALAGQAAQPLPVPRKTLTGWANDINDYGAIVGVAILDNRWSPPWIFGDYTAQLWKDGQRIDLTSQIPGDSGWELLKEATIISNTGIICGYGRFDVQRRGFILIPNTP